MKAEFAVTLAIRFNHRQRQEDLEQMPFQRYLLREAC